MGFGEGFATGLMNQLNSNITTQNKLENDKALQDNEWQDRTTYAQTLETAKQDTVDKKKAQERLDLIDQRAKAIAGDVDPTPEHYKAAKNSVDIFGIHPLTASQLEVVQKMVDNKGNIAPIEKEQNNSTQPATAVPAQNNPGASGTSVATPPPALNPNQAPALNSQLDTSISPKSTVDESQLHSTNPAYAYTVKMLATGNMAFPTGFALKSEYWQKVLEDVSKVAPEASAINYPTRQNAFKDFTSGNASKEIVAIDTAMGHLGHYYDSMIKLNNAGPSSIVGYVGLAQPWNSFSNWVLKNKGDLRITEAENTRNTLAQELTRAYRISGGSKEDVARFLNDLDTANSPEQAKAVVSIMVSNLYTKQKELANKFTRGTGLPVNANVFYSPETQTTLDRFLPKDVAQNKGNTPAPVAAPNKLQSSEATPSAGININANPPPLQPMPNEGNALPTPSPASIQMLREGKGTPQQFDARYGPGASQQYLKR